MSTPSTSELLQQGLFGIADAAVQIRELTGDPHSGSGGRAYAFTLAGGLSFEVLPDRGLDLGAAWFDNQPIAWRAPLGSPDLAPSPEGWLGRFGGGLLVTCGADNIGAPRGNYGQHGSHHDTRAYDVSIQRISSDRAPGVQISGTVDSVETFGRRVRIKRTITSFADDPAVLICDEVTNSGSWPASAALLYHLNFGAPLVLPGTTIDLAATRHERKEPAVVDDSWRTFPEPVDELYESVWQHSQLGTGGDGFATATVTSPTGLVADVTWRTAELPYLVQWIFPPRHSWALGIEPSTSPLFGAQRDTPDAGHRLLQPGDTFQTSVGVRLSVR